MMKSKKKDYSNTWFYKGMVVFIMLDIIESFSKSPVLKSKEDQLFEIEILIYIFVILCRLQISFPLGIKDKMINVMVSF